MNTNKLLLAKTKGILDSIDHMTAKDLKGPPTGKYGKDFNDMWALISEENREYVKFFPPHAEFTQDRSTTLTPYAEIHGFCSQFRELLEEIMEQKSNHKDT